MMRIAVCDNNSVQVERITNMICRMKLASQCDSYIDLYKIVEAVENGADYDIIIMNINWNTEYDGIKAAEKISELDAKAKIIYMTEDTEKYVQEIFLSPANLSGFLVKPVDEAMLEKNLQKVMRTREKPVNRRLEIKYKNEVASVLYEDISYLESMGHLVVIHAEGGDYYSYDRLEKMKENLPEQFVHCHKSYVVNMDYIRRIDKRKIILMNEKEIPISKARYAQTRNRFLEYSEELLLALRRERGSR